MSPSELLTAVSDQTQKSPEGTEKHNLATMWLDIVARDMLSKGRVQPAIAKRFYLPGDGAAIYRE